MQKIYKYASMSSALKIIANESVLLNKPSEFNDSFDSTINIIEKDKKKPYI